MIRQIQCLFKASIILDCLVFVICFWLAQSILQATASSSLIFHSLLFSLVILLANRVIAPMLFKPALSSNVVLHRLCINAIGILIGASFLLLLGILLAWPHIATMIFASILVFFVLGTLSPLKLENKLLQ